VSLLSLHFAVSVSAAADFLSPRLVLPSRALRPLQPPPPSPRLCDLPEYEKISCALAFKSLLSVLVVVRRKADSALTTAKTIGRGVSDELASLSKSLLPLLLLLQLLELPSLPVE
jgi:hypothetical protein